jgi:TRAP transporter TAXI family solute receptor
MMVILIGVSGCHPTEKKPELLAVRMAMSGLGRLTVPLAGALQKVIPDHYPARIEVQKVENSGAFPQMIESRETDLALIQTDLAYVAYTQGLGAEPQPMKKLRALAVLYTTPLHLLATKGSGIRTVMDLRGKRVSVGPAGGATEFTVRMILDSLGISMADIHAENIDDSRLVNVLRNNELDAVFYRGNDPYPLIGEMMRVPGVSFVPISHGQLESIRAHHAFLHSTSVPGGMYGNHPEIETVGGDILLACRADLPDELVYWITRTLFESLPDLADSLPSLRQIDIEHIQAPPIPLHPGAARFYRYRELFP